MNIKKLSTIFWMTIFLVAVDLNARTTAKEPFMSMEQASEAAEIHLRKNGVDIASHYKASAVYRQATRQTEPVWRIEWRPYSTGEIKILGGGIIVYVYASAKTQHVFDD